MALEVLIFDLDNTLYNSDSGLLQEIGRRIRVWLQRVMGVSLPRVKVRFDDRSPYFAAAESSIWIDEAIKKFREVLQLLGTLAEARISLMRLSREVGKTIRRVNALEKIFIPDYDETLKYIEMALEESEREAFFVLKLVKDRLLRKKGVAR